jgi:hypothetical protein
MLLTARGSLPIQLSNYLSRLRRRASWYSSRGVMHVELFLARWSTSVGCVLSQAAEQVIGDDRSQRSFHPQDIMLVTVRSGISIPALGGL